MQTITSVKNPLIKSLKALSRRQERENAGRILVYNGNGKNENRRWTI